MCTPHNYLRRGLTTPESFALLEERVLSAGAALINERVWFIEVLHGGVRSSLSAGSHYSPFASCLSICATSYLLLQALFSSFRKMSGPVVPFAGKPATTRASAFCGWAAETGCGRTQVHEYPFVQEQPVTATPASTRAERRLLVDTLESSDGTGTAMSDCQSEHSLLLPALAPVPSRLPGDMASSAMAFSSFSAGLNENDEQFAPPPFVPVDGLPMISLASVAGLAGGPAPTGWGEERHRSESLTMA